MQRKPTSHVAYATDALLLPRPPIAYLLSGNEKAALKGRQKTKYLILFFCFAF